MIYLKKNTENQVVLTLTESSSLTNPNYLFKFVNEYDLTAVPIFFTTPDVSGYTNRYNKFIITESSSGSTDGGIDVPLALITGQYSYSIYEAETVTLDVEETTGVVLEEGRMVVSGNDDEQVIGNAIDSVYL